MDSGNSGSMQSSSDDQEYNDSRPETYFNHHNSTSPLPFDDPINSLLNFHPTTQQPFFPDPLPSQHINTTKLKQTTTYPDDHLHALKPRNTKKKRSRASRRAPTTVMTTDTGNFRAMVQEFTGISSSPFVIRSSPLDLFATPSASFLLRPFAQKFPPPQLLSTVNYHMQNPIPSVGLDAFGPGRGLQNRPENPFTGGWAGVGVGHNDGADERQLGLLVNGNYDYSHESTGGSGNGNLVNFAVDSSHFRGDKVSEKICGRGDQGNVEPWICSLDQ